MRSSHHTIMHLGLVVAIGLTTGGLTLLGQKYLPDVVVQFANCFSVWLAASFLLGSIVRTRIWALLGGVAVQFLALLGYYATSYIVLDLTLGTYNNALFWASGGLLGGPVLGLAGFWWRSGRDTLAMVATAVLGATFIAEGIYLLRILAYDVGWAFVVVGVVLTLVLAPTWRGRGQSLALATAGSVMLFVLYYHGFGFVYDLTY